MRIFIILALALLSTLNVWGQDSTQMNLDAVYNRPFLGNKKLPVLIGGYLEVNTSYSGSGGVTEGFAFQIPRMTLFFTSSINQQIKFLSEIEIEEGGKEVAIEFAAMDVEFHPLFNFRGGVIMNPIGAFNQNHDGPKWEFVSRPIASTTIIPSTWSNVGMGIFGKTAHANLVFAYEVYLTNGFDNTIIENTENRTWLPSSKANNERFAGSFNGQPLMTVKVAVKHLKIGEIGISWMGGIYNKFEENGFVLDKKRRIDLIALDYNATLPTGTNLVGEYIWAAIDVPRTYSQQFGNKQQGGFLDIIHPLLKKSIFGWEDTLLNLAIRLEYANYNVGTFNETGENIFDHRYAIVPAISFRVSPETVFRFNYRLDWERDILGNPSVNTVGYQFGFSTYF